MSAVNVQGVFIAAAVDMPWRLCGPGIDFLCGCDGFHDAQILIRVHLASVDTADFVDDVEIIIVLNAERHTAVQQIGQLMRDLPDRPFFRFEKAHPCAYQPARERIAIFFGPG